VTHLTTEELLLRLDGELTPARDRHLEGCARCQQSLVRLQAILFEVEHELRSSLGPAPADDKAESWARLEASLYSQQAIRPFPVRWGPVYAAAAALVLAALSGYLATNRTLSEQATTARLDAPAAVQGQDDSSSAAEAPQGRRTAPEAARETERTPETAAANPRPQTQQAASTVSAASSSARGVAQAPRSSPPRFEFHPAPAERPAARTALSGQPPEIAPQARPAFLAHNPIAEAELPAWEEPTLPTPSHKPAPLEPQTSQEPALLVSGYEMLRRAGVWREDIRPVVTASGLRFEGTVEDARARERIVRALRSVSGGVELSFGFASRKEAARPLLAAAPALDRSPSGGVVRNALLAHFHDAALRSFVSPRPSELEAELDRYVSDIFRSQSELVDHVYALHQLLERFDSPQAAKLSPEASNSLQNLLRFHLEAVQQHRGRIYDRLSEALPRRYWSYSSQREGVNAPSSWAQESAALLQDTLTLDANLTALLATPQDVVNAADQNLSCGELLQRIRIRAARLQPSR